MNLFDPNRPTLNGKPCFADNPSVALPHLYIWPLPSGLVELSAMIPIKGQRYMSKWFRTEINSDLLQTLISQYEADPELLLSSLYDVSSDALRPALGQEPDDVAFGKDLKRISSREDKPPPKPKASASLDLTLELI